MKRPLLVFCIFLIAGIVLSSVSNSYLIIVLSIILISFAGIYFSLKNSRLIFIFIGITLFFSIGAFQYKLTNDSSLSKLAGYSEQQLNIKGYIISEPNVGEAKTSYTLQVEQITSNEETKAVSAKVLLTTLNTDSIYDYGEEVVVTATLAIPKGRRNPGGFDYRSYLAQQGVSGTIFAKPESIISTSINKGNILVKTGLMLRGKIVNVIKKSMPPEQAGLLNGMLIGYREGLSEEVQKAFSNSGLTHIMAVSGANVAFLVIPMIFLLRKVLKLRQKTSNIIVIGILVVFVYITGVQPSVLRAVLMAIVILIGQILRREADVYTTISFSAMLLLLSSPSMLYNIGFQLSYVATLSLVLFYKNIKEAIKLKYLPELISDVLAATLAAQVGVLPITVLYFNNVSIISVVTNVLVIPVVELITILGSIMAVVGQLNIFLSQILGYFNSPLLTFVLFVTKTASNVPFAVLRVTTPSLLLVFIYYGCLLFFMWYKPMKKVIVKPAYYLATVIVLIVILGLTFFTPKKLEVVFIDVGEGDSIFIRTYSGKAILIDGGGYNELLNPGTNIGDSVVIPFLLDYGVSHLDLVIATHGHDDHIQGLEAVLNSFPVKGLIIPDIADIASYDKITNISLSKHIKTNVCQEGDIIRLDDQTYFNVVFPNKGWSSEDTLNNCSLVLKLHYKSNSILFTGDMQKEVEQILLSEGLNLHADVLKVAHHGSPYSTTSEFLKAVNPKVAIISVGKNTFGHPAPSTLERLSQSNVKVYRTDKSGAVILTSDGQRMIIDETVRN